MEFPLHRKFLCWRFRFRRSCLTVCWLIFCPASPALKELRKDCYHRVRATLEENVAVRFLLRELPSNLTIRELSVFRRSLISKLLIRRPKTALVPRLCPCPAPFGKEKSTRLRVPLSEKYQVYQSEGGVFRSRSAYEKTVSVFRPFFVERSQLHRIIYTVRFHFVYTIVSLTY